MSNIRVRKETGRLFLDFRVFGIRCREQTELGDSKATRLSAPPLLGRMVLPFTSLQITPGSLFLGLFRT